MCFFLNRIITCIQIPFLSIQKVLLFHLEAVLPFGHYLRHWISGFQSEYTCMKIKSFCMYYRIKKDLISFFNRNALIFFLYFSMKTNVVGTH